MTETKTENRTRQVEVEDLESESLQIHTAAMRLSGSNEEGKVRQLSC